MGHFALLYPLSHDPGGPHPQRLLDQAAQRDLARPLHIRLAGLHRDDVGQRHPEIRALPVRGLGRVESLALRVDESAVLGLWVYISPETAEASLPLGTAR